MKQRPEATEANVRAGYEALPDFKDYVDGYARKHGISSEAAMAHATVKEAWRMYAETAETARGRNG